jgi:hemolysin activation/secretion protein
LSPGISLGRAGGVNAVSYDLQEENLAGWGKDVEVARTSTVDRTSNTASYADPNVLGSHWTSALAYSNASDGFTRSLQLGQPFYSLDTRWSSKLTAVGFDRTVSRYSLGEIVNQFNDDESTYEISGGLSSGLIDGWTKRLLFGFHYDRNQFLPTPASTLPANPLPPDRTLSYPFVGFDIAQDDYARVGDQNQIGKTEDLYFGTEVTGRVGVSNSAFGANRNTPILAATAVHGFRLPLEQELFLAGDFSTRIANGRASNLVSDASARYYWRWREDWLLYAALSATVTDALDPDMQLLLGGDNGLRGYPLRYESGASRALLTVEQRVFTDWYPFRLVRVGFAAFGDTGRTWGSGVVGNSDTGLLSDVGVGLRIGNTRSGLGNVLHIDVALPLKVVPNNERVQFLVQTFQSF